MNGGFVEVTHDFHYDEGQIGKVRQGQVFRLQGHVNDGKLLLHRHLLLLDPQPAALADAAPYLCPHCGRRYLQPSYRERCAQMDAEGDAATRFAARSAAVRTLAPQLTPAGA